MSRSFLPEHNPYFDPIVDEAHSFATSQLGLKVAGVEKVAVVDEAHADTVKRRLGMVTVGRFNPGTGQIVVTAKGDTSNPNGAMARVGSQIVHELAHSGTANLSQHSFYNEAAAGIGEAKYLQWLEAQGRWMPAADLVLHRAGTALWVPGAFRYYNPGSNTDKPGNTSQALVASMGVALGLHNSGAKSADILRASSYGGTEHFRLMKRAVDSLQPGLAREVETFPQTTDGIIQATATIQEVARRRLIK